MKDNRFERITQTLANRVTGVTNRVETDYKNTKPIGYEEQDPIGRVYIYDRLLQEERAQLQQTYPDEYREFVKDVEKTKSKYNINTQQFDFDVPELKDYASGIGNIQQGEGVSYGI